MTFTFRPAKREHTPLIIGLAGPTKSGKTYSAHRIAVGLANGGTVAMINAEGAKGHQYADRFNYIATDIDRPYRPERYTEALRAVLALDPLPAVVIIDSMSHMHDGPGGLLEYHEDELDRMAGKDRGKRDKMNWTAWIKPKAAENEFIYTMLESGCHLILCFRAKEKLKIVRGAEPVDLGYQPIAGDRITFETLFTLMLPPHSKGIPDLAVSLMREPFDTLIPAGKPLSEETGAALAAWAAGGEASAGGPAGEARTSPAAVEDATASSAGKASPVSQAAVGGEPAPPADDLRTHLLELAAEYAELVPTFDPRSVIALAEGKDEEWFTRQIAAFDANIAAKRNDPESEFAQMAAEAQARRVAT